MANNQPQPQVTLTGLTFGVLKEFAGLLAGFAIIITPLLWYLGRMYAEGYFSALKIPISQLSFTIWDYGSVSWSITAEGILTSAILYIVIYYNDLYKMSIDKIRALQKIKKSNKQLLKGFWAFAVVALFVLIIAFITTESTIPARGEWRFIAFSIIMITFAILLLSSEAPDDRFFDKATKGFLFFSMLFFLVVALSISAIQHGFDRGQTVLKKGIITVNITGPTHLILHCHHV